MVSHYGSACDGSEHVIVAAAHGAEQLVFAQESVNGAVVGAHAVAVVAVDTVDGRADKHHAGAREYGLYLFPCQDGCAVEARYASAGHVADVTVLEAYEQGAAYQCRA